MRHNFIVLSSEPESNWYSLPSNVSRHLTALQSKKMQQCLNDGIQIFHKTVIQKQNKIILNWEIYHTQLSKK
jgi:hypothetical protein